MAKRGSVETVIWDAADSLAAMETGWARLGRRVAAERTRRGWATRGDFAAVSGISERVLDDLESASRTNFSATTTDKLDAVFGWVYGSARSYVEGGRISYEVDPQLQRIIDRWPRVHREFRNIIDHLTEVVARRE